MDPARRQVYDRWRESGVAVSFARWEAGGSRSRWEALGDATRMGMHWATPRCLPTLLCSCTPTAHRHSRFDVWQE